MVIGLGFGTYSARFLRALSWESPPLPSATHPLYAPLGGVLEIAYQMPSVASVVIFAALNEGRLDADCGAQQVRLSIAS